MTRAALLLALLVAAAGPSAAQPTDSVQVPGDSALVAARDSAQTAARDSTLAAQAAFGAALSDRVDVLVAVTDSVRQARAAARPWYQRWAWPAGVAALFVVGLAGAGAIAWAVADRRLAASDDAVARTNLAARAAAQASDVAAQAATAATAETDKLRRNVDAGLAESRRVTADAGRVLASVQALVDRDERADRFRDVFREHAAETDADPSDSA